MFCNSYKHVFIFYNGDKIETNIHLEEPFTCSQRPGSMVNVCLVQRLLDGHKENDP